MSLGVLFTCFDEVEAVKFSIEQFRIHYPESKIFLVTESDLSYDEVAGDNIKILNHVDTMGFYSHGAEDLPHNFRTLKNQEKIRMAVSVFLDRLNWAIEYCKSDYMILMDPDVLVRGKLNIPEGSQLLGSLYNTGVPREIKNILSRIEGATTFDSWGATPGILHVETFKRAYQKFLSVPNLLNDLTCNWYAMYAHDIIIPTLFALIGVSETKNQDLTECNTDSNWESSGKPLIHHFKKYVY